MPETTIDRFVVPVPPEPGRDDGDPPSGRSDGCWRIQAEVDDWLAQRPQLRAEQGRRQVARNGYCLTSHQYLTYRLAACGQAILTSLPSEGSVALDNTSGWDRALLKPPPARDLLEGGIIQRNCLPALVKVNVVRARQLIVFKTAD